MHETTAGWALSIAQVSAIMGPVLSGRLATLNVGHEWNFIAFALMFFVVALAMLLVPKKIEI